MRFLSKKYLALLLMVVCSGAICFLCPKTDFENINLLAISNNNVITKDDTIINLYYQNKQWTIPVKNFEINSSVFNIDERIKRYNRNGNRGDKIKLLNKLININISPEIAFNYIYLGFNKTINKIEKNIKKLPQNAEIKINNNKINIKNEIIGIKLDKYLFYNNLIKEYQKNKNIININIPVIKTLPNITREMLQKYTYKRAEFSTSIATSPSARKYNIRKALNSINGTHLGKMQKFSFNNCVGSRTADNGYKNAKIILDGEFVEGVGGGVCQVSSTLYNAVLLSGLKVLKSQKHSQPVSYVKAGFDAMVNYGTSDLVFKNNTEGDIYILCEYSSNNITISIYGASLNNITFKRENEILNQTPSTDTEIIYDNEGKYKDKVIYNDESFELKKSRDGYTIKSYLIKLYNGVEVERLLLRTDKYLPQRRVLVYGTKERKDIDGNFKDKDATNVFII